MGALNGRVAVITGAGKMKFRHVIHAVGPKMGEGDEDRKLSAAVRSSLALADRHGLKSVAIPAISTGNYGFPVERCARILLTEVHRYLQGGTKLQRVIVCLFDEATWKLFAREPARFNPRRFCLNIPRVAASSRTSRKRRTPGPERFSCWRTKVPFGLASR